MTRVLVCGGRKYDKRELVYKLLDQLWVTVLIHGDATGADTLAKEWAEASGVHVEPYPIEAGEGGFARNRRMLRESRPELVVHFPGGNGTKHMRDIAHAAGIETMGGLEGARLAQLDLL